LQDLKETSRLKSGFIHATRGGLEKIPLLKDWLLESQEKLLKAYKELVVAEEEKQKKGAALTEAWKTVVGLNGKIYRVEEEAHVAKEATEKAHEEALRFREQAASAEEAAAKAREEVARYKGEAIELDKRKRLVESDLADARSNYARMKEALLTSEIARGVQRRPRGRPERISRWSWPALATFPMTSII